MRQERMSTEFILYSPASFLLIISSARTHIFRVVFWFSHLSTPGRKCWAGKIRVNEYAEFCGASRFTSLSNAVFNWEAGLLVIRVNEAIHYVLLNILHKPRFQSFVDYCHWFLNSMTANSTHTDSRGMTSAVQQFYRTISFICKVAKWHMAIQISWWTLIENATQTTFRTESHASHYLFLTVFLRFSFWFHSSPQPYHQYSFIIYIFYM